MIWIKNKMTDDFIGKYAKLKYGLASGLIGVIKKNTDGVGVSPYVHVTKAGMKTGIKFIEDIEIVEPNCGLTERKIYMKILTDYEQLVGKTIAFAHMAQFADQITLATTDGEVLMAQMEDRDEWSGDKEINVYNEYMVINTMNHEPYLRQKLSELGIFDLEAYKEKQRKEMEETKRKREEEREKRELEEYKRLKAKFESK